MPSDATHAVPPPRHSVFISYASADRACARALRDTLEHAGLDVWLDEEELGGGEAWDANIRNQIRTCTYFMPVISATTEERREGYFRREWRLAVERTLDLADDVMFLVPVVIDDTRDVGARVPEKFFTVQWLRVPQGQATPALLELAGQLAAGEATAEDPAPPPPSGAARRAKRKSDESAKAPPPFPHFPPYPEHGKAFRFIYDLVIWGGRLLHALWFHLPRFVRVIASIVIIFNLIAWVFRNSDRAPSSREAATAKLFEVTPDRKSGHRTPKSEGKAVGKEVIESLVGAAVDAAQAGRPVALVTFSGDDDDGEAYADHMFEGVMAFLGQDGKQTVGVSPFPLPDDFTAMDAVLRGARLKSQFVLTGHTHKGGPGQSPAFTAKLFAVKESKLLWTETYDCDEVDAAAAAHKVVAAVQQHLAPTAIPPGSP